MNVRQQLYKANRLKGMNQYNAAKAAGYSEKYSRQACRIERLVKVSIIDSLEQAGLTAKYQAEELYKLTQATKVISCNIFIDKKGEMKKADGKSLDFIEVDDPNIRLRTWEHIAELKKQTDDKPLVDLSQHITQIIWEVNGSKIQAPRKSRPSLDRPKSL